MIFISTAQICNPKEITCPGSYNSQVMGRDWNPALPDSRPNISSPSYTASLILKPDDPFGAFNMNLLQFQEILMF